MYQVTINNSEKTVNKGDYLSFTIAGFPPNTNLVFQISECKKWRIVGEGNITSDSNGTGNFLTLCENPQEKYRLYIRNYAYGTAYDDFTVVELSSIPAKKTMAPAQKTATPLEAPVAASATLPAAVPAPGEAITDKKTQKEKVKTKP